MEKQTQQKFISLMIKSDLKNEMTQLIAHMTINNKQSKKMSYSDLIITLMKYYQENNLK